MQRRDKRQVEDERMDDNEDDLTRRDHNRRDAQDPRHHHLNTFNIHYDSNRPQAAHRPTEFDNQHQCRLQKQFQQYEDKQDFSKSTNNSNRRMGAILPTHSESPYYRPRSSSEPPANNKYPINADNVDNETVPRRVNTGLVPYQDYVSKTYDSHSPPTNGYDYEVESLDDAEERNSNDSKGNASNSKGTSQKKKKKSAPPTPNLNSEKSSKKENKSSNKSFLVGRKKSKSNDIKVTDEGQTSQPLNYRGPNYDNNMTDTNESQQNRNYDYKNNPSRDNFNANFNEQRGQEPFNNLYEIDSSASFIEYGRNLQNRREGSRGTLESFGSSTSREILPLPIEIPDDVTDEDAFRQYLSVRRSANCNINPVSLSLLQLSQQLTNVGSTGGAGSYRRVKPSPSGTALNQKNLQNTTHSISLDAHKRTMSLSHAIMTLALLCASASQLRFLVAYSGGHSYPAFNYILICGCIIIEVVVGVGYVILSRFEFDPVLSEQVHSYLIFGLFIVAASNVLICAFAQDDHICEVLAKNTLLYDTVEQPK